MTRNAVIALAYAYLTTLPVIAGGLFGANFLDAERYRRTPATSVAQVAAYGVGHRYAEISTHGYSDSFGEDANFAFFPLYPMLAHAVSAVTGLPAGNSLLLIAYLSLGAMFVTFRAYMNVRFPVEECQNRDYALVALGLWPATFFFRMAYPESLFVLLTILVLLTIEQNRPIWISALIAGLASACRPVGIAAAIPVAMVAWSRWLDAKEIALSIGLLLIPYVTQADRMCMASMARFATVAFPVYIVIGNVLARLPGPIVGLLAAISATMLLIYTAMFVNWYWYY